MTIEMKRKYPFSVDTWTEASKRKPHHFLTHAHKDHTAGIECHGSYPIYCSPITRRIILRRHNKLLYSLFQTLEIAEPKLIPDDEQPFTVTAFDANHCPGSIMLLFEGNFGKVLHTGDCRLTIDCLNKLPPQYVSKGGALDCLYLDCTFGKETMVMPSREDAIQQVIRCIWNNSGDSNVNLACDLLGQEELFHAISKSFGMKIYIDKTKLLEYAADLGLVAPELLTDNKESTRFHICEGFPKLYEKAKLARIEASVRQKPEPLFIRPSTQWYTYEERLQGAGSGLLSSAPTSSRTTARRQQRVATAPTEAEKDQYGVWHVCFSMHSSRSELETALKILNPNQVVSTTPHCGANEIFPSKYQGNAEDADLPNIRAVVVAPHVDSPKNCVLETHEIRKGKIDYTCSPVKRKRDEDSPDRPLPLFGHARYGVPLSPPLSFPSPCLQSLNVETIVTKHASIHSPPSFSLQIPEESEFDGSGTQMLKIPLGNEVSRIHVSDGLQESYSRNPLSPRNANVRRSKRLFGGTSPVKLDNIRNENTICGRVESVSGGNSLTRMHEDAINLREEENFLAVESSKSSRVSRTVRMPRLAPLPSLLDFL